MTDVNPDAPLGSNPAGDNPARSASHEGDARLADMAQAATQAEGNSSEPLAPVTGTSVVSDAMGADRHAAASTSTIVIEGDVIPRRIRRPQDLLRLALAIAVSALILGSAYFASATTAGISDDLTQASTNIPAFFFVIIGFVGFLGVFLLPAAAGIDLIIRKRTRQLVEAACAMAAAIVITFILSWWIESVQSSQMMSALTGSPGAGPTDPLNWVIAGTVSFITVARLIDRTRWAAASILIVLAMVIASLVAGGITVAALALSVLIGWAIGLLVRYLFGTPTTRPSGLEVSAALESYGIPITILRATREVAGGRRYSATTRAGERLEILVLDRDLEGAGLARGVWRGIRMRESAGTAGFTMRSRLEHGALMSYASRNAGANVPVLVAASGVGPDASLLAYSRVEGRTFSELAGELTDEQLEAAWAELKELQEARISHRALDSDNLILDNHGKVWLMDPSDGSIGAGDLSLRLDMAELLCTLGILASAERAISTGTKVMGKEALSQVLPVLQPVAFSTNVRSAIKKRKDVLKELQDGLTDFTPEEDAQPVELQRLKIGTVFSIVAGTVAAYLLIVQLGKIDLSTMFSEANWSWALLALALSGITYLGATMSISGWVPEHLNFWRTTQAQLASDFATLVSPPTVGTVAINLRYMQKSGINPAMAAASIGVGQIMAFIGHLLLMLVFGIIAGQQMQFDIAPPAWTLWVAAVFVALIIALFVLPFTRNWALKRIQPIFVEIGPRFLRLIQNPIKLAEGVGGILILNLGFILCFIASVRAFDDGGDWAAIAIVFLAGATLGQAAPTPGGLGAVEVALTTGLVAAGVAAGPALFAVLLFRLLTFWLPVIPGWFALKSLQKANLL